MRLESDEKYVLDLITSELNQEYEWQKRFDTLVGDPGKNGRRTKLPVDAYFPGVNLIVEYRETQHYKPVKIMDKRMTVSGVYRDEQRKNYDSRKEQWAKDNNILFLVITFNDLKHKKNGRLLRNIEEDKVIIKDLINASLGRLENCQVSNYMEER